MPPANRLAPGGTHAAKHVDHVAIDHRAGANVAGQFRRRVPAQFSTVGIEPPHFARHGNHEVRPPVRGHEGGCSIRQLEHVGFRLPERAARRLVERANGIALFRGVHNQGVLIQNQARSRSPAAVARLFTHAGRPELFALQVERQHAGLAKKDKHPLAIAGGSVAGVAMLGEIAAEFIFRKFGVDRPLPEDGARLAVQADQVPLERGRSSSVRLSKSISRIARHEHANR